MEASRCRPGRRGDSAFEDESMKLRQLKLDNQRALLEKKQRKKRPEPLVAQPNPEARPRGSKPRGSEGHAPPVEPHAPPSGVILHGSDGPAAFLKPDAQDVETRLHVLSVGSSATEEDTEGSADGDSTWDPASKPDLQEILQKHGISGSLNFDEEESDGEEGEGKKLRSHSSYSEAERPSSASSQKPTTDTGASGTAAQDTDNQLGETENLEGFAYSPAPRGVTAKCRITRDKKGMDRGLFPTYYMHLEKDENRKDHGVSPAKAQGLVEKACMRQELAAVCYPLLSGPAPADAALLLLHILSGCPLSPESSLDTAPFPPGSPAGTLRVRSRHSRCSSRACAPPESLPFPSLPLPVHQGQQRGLSRH
ncbi:hypothetical protein J1605_014018 [Eschrichtius robustus]|uniref:Tubby N-terminal domain-containing protein n=1 Tax=Eschrichtius robustus TaxID=9764 RepID=A0AB34GF07_ESCRO|nr:hypothetical protein J1605_014018 [Eschrichtius robustus]